MMRSRHYCAQAVALAISLALIGGCHPPRPSPPPPPEVQVIVVSPTNVTTYREWIGALDGLQHAHVHPQVTGYLIAQSYREGSLVKKGDVMFEIDPRPFQAVLDQALAKLGKDELDVNRLKPLARENAVSQQELDDAVQAYRGDKAAAEQARLNIEFTKVVAPIDGLAGLANADIGDLVGPGSEELTTISTVNPIKAYFPISEQEYLGPLGAIVNQGALAGSGQEPELELILSTDAIYAPKGRFYAVDNQVDPRTGALRAAALFPNPDNVLRPGQFARVRLPQVRRQVLVVPQRAVTELQGNRQVAVVLDNGTVQIRPVSAGERAGSQWIVDRGLSPGERVIVEGLQKVQEGTLVKARPFVATSPAATSHD